MRSHNWRVKLLSEFFPKNHCLLGLNVGSGIHVKLRLRRANNDQEFLPYHEVLDTMLHELCHNLHGPHNAAFYKLWDDIRKECEDLMNKGITGSGKGFDAPGKRLGGYKHPVSLIHQAALTAAEKRRQLGNLLPSGPRKVGGDNFIKSALSPVQAAAMAAERRLQDNIWCGSEFPEDELHDCPLKPDNECCPDEAKTENSENNTKAEESRKRSRNSDGVPLSQSSSSNQEIAFIDLTNIPESVSLHGAKASRKDLSGEASCSNTQRHEPKQIYDTQRWQCSTCTLLNPPLAPICGVCEAQKPKDNKVKSSKISWWMCRFCTLENDVKLDSCAVCGAWRYSHGPPVAATPLNKGT